MAENEYITEAEYAKLTKLGKFKWFLSASKSLMGYGKRMGRTEFWLRFPHMAFRFWRLSHNG